jgi:hypothetical protein
MAVVGADRRSKSTEKTSSSARLDGKLPLPDGASSINLSLQD